MSLRDWDSLGDVARLWDELDRLAECQLGPARPEAHWCPAVDIREREDALVVLVDLPGLRREDIHVRVEANVLTLEGTRAPVEGPPGVRLERPVGRFARSFRFGPTISTHDVQATYREGVLEIVLRKASRQQQPARVRVSVE